AASDSRADAWYSPSALMTLARRSRSASAWRAIARCISCGRSTFLISTLVTFTPQVSVVRSMICCSAWLNFLRSILGQQELDELLAEREKFNQALQQIIDRSVVW